MSSAHARLRANAEILSWQSKVRIAVASIAAGGELLLMGESSRALSTLPSVPAIVLVTTLYIAIAATTAWLAETAGELPNWMVVASVVSDVMLVFTLTIAASPPQYYDRILILSFFALHLTTFYFGRRLALLALAMTTCGYVALVSATVADGGVLHWHEEAWSLGAFLLAAAVLLVEHGSLAQRMSRIVELFRRAEEGDFSEAYDEGSDSRPDGITHVGRAYNRVRAQLASMVLTDALTGCVNRRGFDQALAREVARTSRAGSELALLALDIDHFKAVNDTLGHPAGDAVLREVGALLLRTAREGDVVARTGGEEFSLVLPDTSAAGAYQLAVRLGDALRDHRFTVAAHRMTLTVSIGVVAADSSLRGSARDVAEALKGRADEALYAAKRGGRDRVRAWARRGEERVPASV